jgi:hypothetical protein
LHLTWRHCADRLAEVTAGDVALNCGGTEELCVIDEVEGFDAEFERVASFYGDGGASLFLLV